MTTADVAIVGGGVIGLAIAWRVAQRGLAVTVIDRTPGRGASYVAAGMLAPVTEAQYGEEALLTVQLESARRYPAFVAELGADVGYTTTGTLAVALDAGDRAVLADLHAYQQRLGLDSHLLTGRECRALEPLLAPTVRGGLFVSGDHAVDPRRLVAALRRAAVRAGAVVVEQPVIDVQMTGDRATGVRIGTGETVAAGSVVLAAGCWTGQLPGVPPDALPPVRPVKGQILRLRGPGFLSRNVRGIVTGGHVYVVPRPDGEVVVGATVEETGFDTTVRAGGVYELLRDAHGVLPGLTELELVETSAGLRPGSPDNAPIVGPTPVIGLIVATGHYRNGILLAPVTADAVSTLLTDGEVAAEMRAFSPRRFQPAGATR